MEIFIGLMIVVFIITMFAVRRRNRRMDEANDAYRDAADALSRGNQAANASLQRLREMVQNPDRREQYFAQLGQALAEYTRLYEQIEFLREAFRNAQDEAYEAYASGVDKQNLYFGGANDVTVYSLRKRYREYRQIRVAVSLVNPNQTLMQAYRILDQRNFTGRLPESKDGATASGAQGGQEQSEGLHMGGAVPADDKPAGPGTIESAPRKKRRHRGLAAVVLILILLVGGGYLGKLYYYDKQPGLYGTASKGSLVLSVAQNAAPVLKINYQNGMTPYTLGWVHPSGITLVTDEGLFKGQIIWFGGKKLRAESKGFFLVYSSFKGNLASIIIDDISPLNGRGLPEGGFAQSSLEIPLGLKASSAGGDGSEGTSNIEALQAGENEYKGLVFKAERHPGNKLLLRVLNTGRQTFALGWTSGSELVLAAKDRQSAQSLGSPVQILPGSEKLFTFSFPLADENWQSITVDRVIRLDSRNLPVNVNANGETVRIKLR